MTILFNWMRWQSSLIGGDDDPLSLEEMTILFNWMRWRSSLTGGDDDPL
jgi:hypothetical protein